MYASPSGGSQDADRLRLFIDLIGNKSAKQLQTGSDYLKTLDRRFKAVLNQKRIPNLRGAEAVENHFLYSGWLGGKKVVSQDSGGRYFNRTVMLPNTDHFSIVKPINQSSASHLFLRDFFSNEFAELRR